MIEKNISKLLLENLSVVTQTYPNNGLHIMDIKFLSSQIFQSKNTLNGGEKSAIPCQGLRMQGLHIYFVDLNVFFE